MLPCWINKKEICETLSKYRQKCSNSYVGNIAFVVIKRKWPWERVESVTPVKILFPLWKDLGLQAMPEPSV